MRLDVGDLLGQNDRIDYHAVADDVDRTVAENSRRNGVQNKTRIAEMERMSGIGTTLKTGDNLIRRGQYIHDLTLAFVAPL